MRTWLLLLLACALTACARAAGGPATGTAVAMKRLEGGPDADRWLAADTQRARAAGAGDRVLLGVSAGAPGDRILATLQLAEQSCALLLARGAPSVEDIDLFAYSDDGTTLGADESPETTASLIICPPHPRTVYVVARIAAGHGIVAMSSQEVPAARAEKVGRTMNARGRPGEQAATEEAWPELDEKLAARRRVLGGTWQVDRRVALPLDPRIASRVSVRVPTRGCTDVLVVPSDEVAHVDVTVLDARGRVVGRARAVGRDRAVVVCASTRSTVTVELRPHAGNGLAAVLVSHSTSVQEADLPLEVVRYDLTPLAALPVALAVLDDRLQEEPYGSPEPTLEGTGKVGHRQSHHLKLKQGCSRIDVVLGAPSRGVEAWLYDENRRLVAHADGGAGATLFACTVATDARLDVEPLARGGPYAISMRPARRASKALVEHPLVASRLLSRLGASGLANSPEIVGDPKAITLTDETLVTEEMLVPVGRCAAVAVAAGAGATGIELRLIDARTDAELELVVGTHSAAARVCAGTSPSLALRAELRASVGAAPALFARRLLQGRR